MKKKSSNRQLALPTPKRYAIFAYGSNMNQRQMAFRCPTARVVCVARLDGYQLRFAGHNSRWGGGVATVVPARRASVTGVVWSVSQTELERLDTYEGYPYVYDRAPVIVHAASKREIWCHTYMKNADEVPTSPSEEYLRAILDGYHTAGVRAPAQLLKLYEEMTSAPF